jgi:hypothetical protein
MWLGVLRTLGSIKLPNFLLKQSKNAAGRVAVLELSGEWVDKNVFFCASLICFQGIILEVGGLVGGRCGSRVRKRHKGGGEGG